MKFQYWLSLLLVVAFLSACAGGNRPFENPNKNVVPPLLQLGPRIGMTVSPVVGTPGELGPRDLSDKLVLALRKRDIAASTRALSRSSHFLSVSVTDQKISGPYTIVSFAGQILAPTGQKGPNFQTALPIPTDQWLAGDAKLLDNISRELAAAIDRSISVGARSMAPEVPVRLDVRPCDGAPGDGNTALAKGAEDRLVELGVRLAFSSDLATHRLQCFVKVRPGSDKDFVSMRWRVITAEGQEMGVVDLSNHVLSGQVNLVWASVAKEAGAAGAEGVYDLLVQLHQNKLLGP